MYSYARTPVLINIKMKPIFMVKDNTILHFCAHVKRHLHMLPPAHHIYLQIKTPSLPSL